MEGHPRYEDPGATPVPGRLDSSDLTRKRVFLSLDGERRSLTAQLRPWWRRRGRYEDLSLVMRLARLERDWLSQSWPHLLSGGDQPKGHRDQPGRWLADWAKPWGAAARTKLDADIRRVDEALTRLGMWLSRRAVAKAEGRARERLESITTELEGRNPQARAMAAPAQGAATKTRVFEPPTRTRVAAIAGLFLLAAGAGAFLFASHTGNGPGDSAGRQGAVAGVRQHPGALDVQIQRGSGQHSRDGGQSANPPSHPGTQGSARARSQGAGQSAPAGSEIAPPAPEPAPAPQPVAAPQPAPQPAAAPAPPSSTSSQAKSAAGGSCPPEFGYEC
jgi:hypothetical protein